MLRYLLFLLPFLLPKEGLCQWPGQGASAPGQAKQAQQNHPDTKRHGTFVEGNSATGGEGCYFGDCGDAATAPPPQPKSRPKSKPVDETDTASTSPPPPAPRSLVTNICQTPGLWCVMNQSGAVGMPCYCNLPFPMGFANGVTVARQ